MGSVLPRLAEGRDLAKLAAMRSFGFPRRTGWVLQALWLNNIAFRDDILLRATSMNEPCVRG
jgi:hypothetical protein